jgi:hypothetical protein
MPMKQSAMQFLKTLRSRWRIDPAAVHRVDEGRRSIEQRLVREVERLLQEAPARRLQRHGTRTLVMGLAANYGVAELAPFVLSLRQSGYTGDIALLTYGCSSETAEFLRAHRVRMVPFTSLAAMPMSMNSARMFRYLDWFIELFLNSATEVEYCRVLLTDIRDVVFQGDPFARAPTGRVLFFLESERTIGTCPINSDWMTRAYGASEAQELADQPVSCAGTVMGTPDGLLEYLAHMVRDIIAVPPHHRFSGVDQAIHNHILARRLIDGAVSVPNGGAVMTVPSKEPTGIRLLDDGGISNPDGSRSEVVHQYDRDYAVAAAVAERYRA